MWRALLIVLLWPGVALADVTYAVTVTDEQDAILKSHTVDVNESRRRARTPMPPLTDAQVLENSARSMVNSWGSAQDEQSVRKALEEKRSKGRAK